MYIMLCLPYSIEIHITRIISRSDRIQHLLIVFVPFHAQTSGPMGQDCDSRDEWSSSSQSIPTWKCQRWHPSSQWSCQESGKHMLTNFLLFYLAIPSSFFMIFKHFVLHVAWTRKEEAAGSHSRSVLTASKTYFFWASSSWSFAAKVSVLGENLSIFIVLGILSSLKPECIVTMQFSFLR